MTMRKKLLITIACLSVILCTLVTGTIAWLTEKTPTIENKFTPSNIKVTLTEDNNGENYNFKMIPGKTYAKDPKVTVTTDIPCYVFVKVAENLGEWASAGKTFADYFDYSVITGDAAWKALDGVSGVYYREVSATGSFYVLNSIGEHTNGAITVKGDAVTKEMMDKLYANDAVIENVPKLTFTAYVCQKEGFNDAAAAWAEAKKAPASNGN